MSRKKLQAITGTAVTSQSQTAAGVGIESIDTRRRPATAVPKD
jgi:hypothetical protein